MSIYDPLSPEYRLTSDLVTEDPSIGIEIEASLVVDGLRTDLSSIDLPDQFAYEIDRSVVEYNAPVLHKTSTADIVRYIKDSLVNIIEFAESNNSIISPFGITPLRGYNDFQSESAKFLASHPLKAYRKLMERDLGKTVLLTGATSIQCHVQQNNFDAILRQNILHSIFAPCMTALFANSVVFDGILTDVPSNRIRNKMQMNFSGSIDIPKLLSGSDSARDFFIQHCNEMSSISPGYYLVRYFRPDLGTVENCSPDFCLNAETFSIFVRMCKEISNVAIDPNVLDFIFDRFPEYQNPTHLNELTSYMNNSRFSLSDYFHSTGLLEFLSDDILISDIQQLINYPNWKESVSFLEKRGVSLSSPEIDSDLMVNYINYFYNQFVNSLV